MTVRSALAVRPPRPMTLPRSSGWTRTSSTRPRRRPRLPTWTSSGCSTMPLTRCSRASSSMSGSAAFRLVGRHLGLSLSLGLSGRRRIGSCTLRLGGRLLARRLLGLSRLGLAGLGLAGLGVGALGLGTLGLRAALGERLRRRRRESRLLVSPRLGGPKRALGARQTLEFLPVAGDLQELAYRVGRLRADGQPVLSSLGVNLDEGRLGLRVVLADLLDRSAIPLGAGVGDDDPVIRRADLAH